MGKAFRVLIDEMPSGPTACRVQSMPLMGTAFGPLPILPEFERSDGISLIELIIFILVVGIAVTGVLSVMIQTTAHSADPVVRKQIVAIAESLLEEVTAQPFTWCDPDDANLTTAANAAGCATLAEALGPEAGETRHGPVFFDSVNDYHGFTMTGLTGLDGAAIAGLADYSASVTVAQDGASFSVAADAALRISVTVSGRGESFTLTGYRFRHSPNAGG
jgi:MSHA pilin protein MshD